MTMVTHKTEGVSSCDYVNGDAHAVLLIQAAAAEITILEMMRAELQGQGFCPMSILGSRVYHQFTTLERVKTTGVQPEYADTSTSGGSNSKDLWMEVMAEYKSFKQLILHNKNVFMIRSVPPPADGRRGGSGGQKSMSRVEACLIGDAQAPSYINPTLQQVQVGHTLEVYYSDSMWYQGKVIGKDMTAETLTVSFFDGETIVVPSSDMQSEVRIQRQELDTLLHPAPPPARPAPDVVHKGEVRTH
mmetsp:Transcript_85533/g.125190  ORF Transcript_85533/g.125190 Transcript_85533/m.125190 type:complete len:245 (+) Transcript_85533:38-772(+)